MKPKNQQSGPEPSSRPPVQQYRWEFLRRNDNYVEDCERWSGVKANKWHDREIILGYPYPGRMTALSLPWREQEASDLRSYFLRYQWK